MPTSRLASRLARVAAAVLTGALIALPASPAQAADASDAQSGAPAVGACYNYDLSQSLQWSYSGPAVACSSTHTAQTLAVRALPPGITWETATELQLFTAAEKVCRPAYNAALGRTEWSRQRSAYRRILFLPNEEQRAAGARWMRCDIVRPTPTALLPIARNLALPNPLTNATTSCIDGEIRFTVCTKRHAYRAGGVVTVTDAKYPSRSRFTQIATERCPRLVSTPRSWHASWMSLPSWRAGDRSITCYSRNASREAAALDRSTAPEHGYVHGS